MENQQLQNIASGSPAPKSDGMSSTSWESA